mmetsp:Transcript_31256/g.75560  ORF Transcript_31256/g.75560 Transcript_31256/m.75560 type:complete len:523 (-) Transcript_31256:288-1856(-)
MASMTSMKSRSSSSREVNVNVNVNVVDVIRRVIIASVTLHCLLVSGSTAFQHSTSSVMMNPRSMKVRRTRTASSSLCLQSRNSNVNINIKNRNFISSHRRSFTGRLSPSPSSSSKIFELSSISSSSSPSTNITQIESSSIAVTTNNENESVDIDVGTLSSSSSATAESTSTASDSVSKVPSSSSSSSTTSSSSSSSKSFLSVLWRFTRPHTIIGSALAVPCLYLLASPSYGDALTVGSIGSMIYAMVPALLMNLYITGLNQVTDVEIDKVNKPDLPLAAGDWTVRRGTIVVIASLIVSVAMSFLPPYSTPGLHVALGFSAVLGTLYSLPPARLKRFPLLAAFCIVAVRGAVINAGFYSHAQVAAFGTATDIGTFATVWKCLTTDMKCMLSSLYFAVFGVVIALMKDVPDVKGDDLANVRTFSVRLGPKVVYKAMHRLLTGLFWGVGIAFFKSSIAPAATITTATVTVRVGRAAVATFAMLAGASVQKQAKPVDPENSKQVYNFYMHLWKLFYMSYFFLPFAR